jgi:arabinofuranosyltransferase
MTDNSPVQSPQSVRLARMRDAVIALITTALCSFLVYRDLGKPMLTGIDDENITQAYGRNLANGFGYVYTPHFEHVEGATSPLWVALHYVLYKITAHPEPYVLMFSAALTALAIYWSLGIARCISAALALPRWALWIPVLAIAAQPNYFHWTVVSMMDQGLWGALVLGLVFVLVRRVTSSEAPERASALGVVLCVSSILARPESMLLLPAMLALAGVVVAVNKGVRAALSYVAPYYAAVLLTLMGLTVLRLTYFGYPLPNTYYAKVSSNPIDNIVMGLHYVVWFLNSNILAVPSVLAAALGLMVGVRSLLASAKAGTRLCAAHSVMLLVGGTMAFVIATIILEGGDHFPGFRLFQPYVPLICVALTFYVPLLADWSRLRLSRISGLAWSAAIVGATIVASYSAFPLTIKGLKEDFALAVEGRRIGDLLNALPDQPAPDVGVLPAGGIAVSYHGRVVDLLGLNWAEMGHASGRRTGMPGHSAFNLQVFWKHPPAIMLPTLTDPAHPLIEKQTPGGFDLYVLQGLLNETRFRDDYRPVLMHLGDGEIFAYARADFIDEHHNDPRIVPMAWERFRSPSPTMSVAAN